MREFDLLRHIYAANAGLPPRVTIPPGDDMGAVRLSGGGGEGGGARQDRDVLMTVDQVADGVHFDLRTTPLAKVGRKAITRNLSDVAAMAAKPVAAVAAACLPRDFGEALARELCDALRTTAAAYDCPLIGGDLAMWDHPLIVTVTILAEPWPGVAPVLRQGAQVGDTIFVTGPLGGSLETVNGHTHHLDFEPRLEIARVLASDPRTRPHCMIDLSDGLARDLGHLLEAAGLTARLGPLPISPAAEQAAARDRRAAWEHALGDGEDYELCFTVSRDAAALLQGSGSRPPAVQAEGVSLIPIGTVTGPSDGPRLTVALPDGTTRPVGDLGWEHRG